jgi:nitrogen regulatory protein P-II 2
MEYVMAMLRPEKLFPVKKELQKIEVNSLTVSSIAGYGSQRGYLEIDRAKLKI